MTETADFPPDRERPAGWLPPEEITRVRGIMPLVYVDAVPVRVDDSGDVVAVGLLLRVTREGVLVFNQAGALPPAALKQVVQAVKDLDMDEVRAKIAAAPAAEA